MDTDLLRETVLIQQDLRHIQATVAVLQGRIEHLKARLEGQAGAESPGDRFADLEGIWADIEFSPEMIEAAEYRLN